MGGLLPIPPSSAYCVQRSDSRISAAARNRRIAMSPLRRLFSLSQPNARVSPPAKPAPIATAPPASTPCFKSDLRFTARFIRLCVFSITPLFFWIEKHHPAFTVEVFAGKFVIDELRG